ncbi:MAG: Clp protease ClpP [Oscillospiraceae bacterium]|nr:Clp protease ClpP [Oscillospiraceae bacterium]MBR4657072.1 Clp protease ClpP [Oscillospiraceae bacterium]
MSTMKPVQIVRAGQSADLYIFGDLVEFRWFDDDVSPNSFRRELQRLTEEGVQEINVHIDSYGGAVSAGWAIYNALKDWPGTVNSFADGFVASAAVYPFLAGQRRAASPVSAFFLHQAWISTAGNADELRKAADDLDKMNDIGLEAFAAAGIDRDKVLELEKEESWLSAFDALELGLATEVLDRGEEQSTQQSVRAMIVQALTKIDTMTVNERRESLGLEPIQETHYWVPARYAGAQSGEKPAEEAGIEQREPAPEPDKETGAGHTNHLMAFLTKARQEKE